jgi:hemolysin activation/secretion protein
MRRSNLGFALFMKSSFSNARSRALTGVLVGGVVWCTGLGVSVAAHAAEPLRFDIYEFRVEGNSLLDEGAIERAVSPHMGEGKSLAQVEAARATLERQYRDAGYLTVLVSIPEQNTDGGVVTLKVTAAPVSKLRVVGSQFHLPSNIKSEVTEVAEGKVPNFTELQRQLADVNRTGDLKVAPVLKPGKAPGTVEVQLEVDDQLPLHGSVELTNRQSPNTTPARLGASLRFDNLWQRGHSLGLTLQTSPQALKEMRLAVVNYMLPLGPSGAALTAYGVMSRSNFATIFNSPGIGVLGNSDIMGLRYSLPLASDARYVQSLSAGLDYKNIRQSLVADGAREATPAVSYLPLALSYRGTWLDQGAASTTLDASAIMGLRGLLGNTDEEFSAKRPGASASFMALRTGLQVNRDIGRWSLSAKLEAQLASGPLLPSEQFVAGGADSVRGYLEGERSGDTAVRMALELSSPAIKLDPKAGQWRLVGVTFLEGALLRTLADPVTPASRYALGGAGFGLRLTGPKGMGLQLDAATALRDGDVSGGGTHQGDWRIHARWAMEF